MVNFQTSGGGPVSREASKENARRNIYSFLDALTISDGGREGEERREVGSCRFLIELARSNLS